MVRKSHVQSPAVPVDGTISRLRRSGAPSNSPRSVGAHITFFHAQPDHAASLSATPRSYGSRRRRLHLCVRRPRRSCAQGGVRGARAQGVPRRGAPSATRPLVRSSRHARCGCDLIFMASHGRRSQLGMMLGSRPSRCRCTLGSGSGFGTANPGRQRARSGSSATSTGRSPRCCAPGCISSVARGARHPARPCGDGGHRPLPRDVPVALHHPRRTRISSASCASDVRNRCRHRGARAPARARPGARRRARGDGRPPGKRWRGPRRARARRDALRELHLGASGRRRCDPAGGRATLTEADWVEINAAFAENRDPASAATRMRSSAAFSRIVNLAPA